MKVIYVKTASKKIEPDSSRNDCHRNAGKAKVKTVKK